MRVLMVSDVYFPRVNGVSTSIETFRRTLSAHGVEVKLVVPRYGNELYEPGIVRVAGRPVPGDREDRLVGWRAMHRAVLEAAQDCDLIHVQTPFIAHYAGLKAARKLGLPVVATYHTLFEEYLQHYAKPIPPSWLRGQARALSRRQCNQLDAVIVPSTAMRQRLESYGVKSPMHVLPTGIPMAQFAGGSGMRFRQKFGIAESRPMALFVGRVAHEKNIGFLLEALVQARQIRPDVLLVIAGEGPAMADLRAQTTALGLQVLLEAMAAGVPVIALSEMGTIDILAPARGAFSPPNDPRAFGEVLGQFLKHPESWRHLNDEAPIYAQEWTDVAMAERLARLYSELSHCEIGQKFRLTVAI